MEILNYALKGQTNQLEGFTANGLRFFMGGKDSKRDSIGQFNYKLVGILTPVLQ
jgi:hypothetical protein